MEFRRELKRDEQPGAAERVYKGGRGRGYRMGGRYVGGGRKRGGAMRKTP